METQAFKTAKIIADNIKFCIPELIITGMGGEKLSIKNAVYKFEDQSMITRAGYVYIGDEK